MDSTTEHNTNGNTNGNGNGTPTSRAEVLALVASLDATDRNVVSEITDPATESDGLDRAEVLRSWTSLMGTCRRALLTAADAAAEEEAEITVEPSVLTEAEPPALTDADIPVLTAAEIPWGEPVASTRDRTLGARLEYAIGTGGELEQADRNLAAVQVFIDEHPAGCDPYGQEGPWRDLLRFHVVKLLDLDYQSYRLQLAKGAGWQVAQLDKERAKARKKPETGTEEAAAEDSDAAPKHLTLADTIDAAASLLRRYIVFADDHQVTAVALWVAHTYVFHFFDTTPYLNVGSAQPECGKTHLLETIEHLVSKPWLTGLPTEAVLFRKIAAVEPSLLLDENDPIWKGRGSDRAEGLRAILNMGNRRGATVPRCVGDDHAIQEFPVFCPKALAGIGDIPDTLASRSIRIELKRKLPGEHVKKFRRRDVSADAAGVAASLRWHTGRLDLAEARPKIPDVLTGRAADGWEPLFAIADGAGGNWPEDARDAAKVLSVRPDNSDGALSIRLLADIKDAFAHASTDRIFSRDLLAALAMIEDAPWGEMPGRSGRPLSAHALGRLLRPYGIRSRDVRIPPTNGKGFLAEDFVDVWARYTSEATPPPEATPEHRSNGDTVTSTTADPMESTTYEDLGTITNGDSDQAVTVRTVTEYPVVTVRKGPETIEKASNPHLSPCHRSEGPEEAPGGGEGVEPDRCAVENCPRLAEPDGYCTLHAPELPLF